MYGKSAEGGMIQRTGTASIQIGLSELQGKFVQEGGHQTPKPHVIGVGVCDAGRSLLLWAILRRGANRDVMGRNENEIVWVFSNGISCLIRRGDQNGQGE